MPRVKLYIAGPMRGHEDLNFPAFNEAASLLRERGYKVENPAEYGDDPKKGMARGLTFISLEAEGVILLPCWEHSRGALAEVAAAEAVEVPVWDLSTILLYGPDPKKTVPTKGWWNGRDV